MGQLQHSGQSVSENGNLAELAEWHGAEWIEDPQ
jgi:hypothetical protein